MKLKMLYARTYILGLKVESKIRLNYIFAINAIYIIGLEKNIHTKQLSLRCTGTYILNHKVSKKIK